MARLSRRNFIAVAAAATVAPRLASAQRTPGAIGKEPKELPENIDNIFYDGAGFIVDQRGGGGDTSQREGMYWFGNWIRTVHLSKVSRPWLRPQDKQWYGRRRIPGLENAPSVKVQMALAQGFDRILASLEAPDAKGRYRRHPTDTTKGYNDWRNNSRDQLVPLIAAMGVWERYDRLRILHEELKKSLWLTNPDPFHADWMIGFETFIERARDQGLSHEIDHLFMDKAVDWRFEDIANSKTDRLDNVGDDLNVVMQLVLAKLRQKTEYVDAIAARFARDRPANYGMYLATYRRLNGGIKYNADNLTEMAAKINAYFTAKRQPDHSKAVGALAWYFRAEDVGSPGLAEMWRPIYREYLGA